MKLWVDDLRDPPDESWTIARNSREAIPMLQRARYDVMSLDHDLGADDTSRVIVLWLCQDGADCWPGEVRVHSANPRRPYLAARDDRALPASLKENRTMNTTTPHALADPDGTHVLPESDDGPTATERRELERNLLGNYAEDRNVLAAYRAGWDRGVTDHADATT